MITRCVFCCIAAGIDALTYAPQTAFPQAKKGDDTKGTAIYLRDAAQVVLSGCLILNNEGHGIAEGTVTLGGTSLSRLHVEHSIFDGNWARLGSWCERAASAPLSACAAPAQRLRRLGKFAALFLARN